MKRPKSVCQLFGTLLGRYFVQLRTISKSMLFDMPHLAAGYPFELIGDVTLAQGVTIAHLLISKGYGIICLRGERHDRM